MKSLRFVLLCFTLQCAKGSNCFTFDECGTGEMSVISHTARPSLPGLAQSVATYTLAGAGEGARAVPVTVYFTAPQRNGPSKSESSDSMQHWTQWRERGETWIPL